MSTHYKITARNAIHLMLASISTFFRLATKAQQIGDRIAEIPPRLTTWRCNAAEGCLPQNTSVVLDASFRWIHVVDGYDSCTVPSGELSKTICPDAITCARNCAIEGANYASAGVHTWSNSLSSSDSSSLTLDMYIDGQESSPRVYLLGEDGDYEDLQLFGQELTFDVDLSKMPCGTNGALYLSEMSLSGGRSDLNSAGASMGTGYCDAQCPVMNFIDGELDVWEANTVATALTPHPCNTTGVYACSGQDCVGGDSGGICDKSGCVYNTYGQGYHNFYGPEGVVDTTKPFTVVTQFFADSSNSGGGQPVLKEIRRLYIQNDEVITGASSSVSAAMVIDDAFCGDGVFEKLGGLEGMGQALQRGMVLVFSIWNDESQFMNWLDSNEAGPCDNKAGDPATILNKSPGTSVTWSNVRWGDVGSTFGSHWNPKGESLKLKPKIREMKASKYPT
ncbi:beta-glucanase [Grosmannia clavigera kw1407]|uniref:Glucanase n=1 Tax=Grosmannia clavigera (strain kw1407 / UAMH 11150) TaxID=655863 RepID=F0XMQ4_GROCL|nr:beta-glucanase [Grosmannia clavigera kw1407]EFX01237.1 beta-glucanase [Grosmannia clavigera kw1407]